MLNGMSIGQGTIYQQINVWVKTRLEPLETFRDFLLSRYCQWGRFRKFEFWWKL